MMATTALMALLATPLLAQTQQGQKRQGKGSDQSVQTFVTKAANGGMFEVEQDRRGQGAEDKTQRADVKAFAQEMVEDHGEANKELEQIAVNAKLDVARKMDRSHQAKVDKLKGGSGASFDRQYLDAQNEAHKEVVQLFDNYAKTGGDPDLKAFASKTVTVIKNHRTHLQQLEESAAGGAQQQNNPPMGLGGTK